MLGEMVPRGSWSRTSMRASALWANAKGEALKIKGAPARAAALRRNCRRSIVRSTPERKVVSHGKRLPKNLHGFFPTGYGRRARETAKGESNLSGDGKSRLAMTAEFQDR